MTRRESSNATAGPVVKARSLSEQIAVTLRRELFIGEMPPGSTFSVPALAERFQVSATPVREAVLDLVREELVVALPNKGFRVIDPSLEGLRHSLEVRRLLEIPASVAIAEGVTQPEVNHLRELAEATLKAGADADLRAFVEADYEFHWRLTELCGNPVLSRLIEDFRSRARVIAVPNIAAHGGLVAMAREHLDLIDAMERHDLSAVRSIVGAHMDRTFVHVAGPPDAGQP